MEGEAIRVGKWPVQFIPAFIPLTEEAMREAETAEIERRSSPSCQGGLSCTDSPQHGKTQGLRTDPRLDGIRRRKPGQAGALGSPTWSFRSVACIQDAFPGVIRWTRR